MATQEHIQEVADRLGEAAQAERVILFGSHARGEGSPDSDVDFLIIADSDLPRFKRSRSLYKMFRPYPFAMDLLVCTPEEVAKGRRTPLSFISTALKEGKTLYER